MSCTHPFHLNLHLFYQGIGKQKDNQETINITGQSNILVQKQVILTLFA